MTGPIGQAPLFARFARSRPPNTKSWLRSCINAGWSPHSSRVEFKLAHKIKIPGAVTASPACRLYVMEIIFVLVCLVRIGVLDNKNEQTWKILV